MRTFSLRVISSLKLDVFEEVQRFTYAMFAVSFLTCPTPTSTAHTVFFYHPPFFSVVVVVVVVVVRKEGRKKEGRKKEEGKKEEGTREGREQGREKLGPRLQIQSKTLLTKTKAKAKTKGRKRGKGKKKEGRRKQIHTKESE